MSYPFPLRYCANYMEERPSDYACHSSMIGGPWIIMDRASEWSDQDIASAKRNVALYKELRPLFRTGRVFHLRMPDSVSWDALQIQHPDGHGAALVFQPQGGDARQEHIVLKLRGLDPARIYNLRSSSQGDPGCMPGQSLMQDGLRRTLVTGSSEVILW
jgi:alpha-galactosidase